MSVRTKGAPVRRLLTTTLALSALVLVPSAFAQTHVPLTISGNEARGHFELPGSVAGDLSITFEEVVGLTEDALEVSARLVNPTDSAILSRLPGPGVSVPEAFPVMIRIEPTASSALTFAGVVSVSLHTHNLVLVANSPLALYSGPADGPLHDITRFVGVGSYRAGGSGGGFSEFMIVADTRPLDVVIAEKFGILESTLGEDLAQSEELEGIGGDQQGASRAQRRFDAVAEVQRRFQQARTLYAAGATVSSISEVVSLMDYIKFMSGDAIPNVYRANDEAIDRVNIAGRRRAAADTLRFSLVKAAVPGSQPTPAPTPPPLPEPTPPPAPSPTPTPTPAPEPTPTPAPEPTPTPAPEPTPTPAPQPTPTPAPEPTPTPTPEPGPAPPPP